MLDISLMDLVLVTIAVLIVLSLFFCLCCVCMELSDLKLMSYILDLSKKKGVKVDLDALDPKNKCESPYAKEGCAIYVPEVGIIP